MIENVGKVILDLSKYSGIDLYSDGLIEDRMLSLAMSSDCVSEDEISSSWPVFYHFSPIRENIVSWLPIGPSDDVLEIGSGCGAITGALSKMARQVDTIDLSKKRSLINAYRHKDKSNIRIHVGNFLDMNLPGKYDWISLIGVFEYAKEFGLGEDPYRTMLLKVKQLLKPGGRLIIAIENKFGLKYWAGCREDHTGKLFDNIQGYPDSAHVVTFSKSELENLLLSAGFGGNSFYYPMPDYKLPKSIYSDSHLPKRGEIRDQIVNFDQDRLYLFDERLAWDELLKADQFCFFANSFLVISSLEEAVHD
jgi:SAM-dependent methyltransferase